MWEYSEITGWTNSLPDLMKRLNIAGTVGWKAFGAVAVDPTVGLNSITVLTRREVAPWPEPAEPGEGWKPDPAGRFAYRWWDEIRWTQHVNSAEGVASIDFPSRATR